MVPAVPPAMIVKARGRFLNGKGPEKSAGGQSRQTTIALDFFRAAWHNQSRDGAGYSLCCEGKREKISERRSDCMELMKFKELESKLKNLIEEFVKLKDKNLELEAALKNKITELEEAENKFKEFKEERDSIRTKVDSLLELLQDIGVAK
jgi:chromosome segregation ATPase